MTCENIISENGKKAERSKKARIYLHIHNKKEAVSLRCARLPRYGHPPARLIIIFRRLWREQVFWTQALIVSAWADLGDLPYIRRRLSRHAHDFAEVLKVFYGQKKAARLACLWRNHFTLAGKLIEAARQGGPVYPVRNQWEANAALIAAVLSRPDRQWLQVWRGLLNEYLAITEEAIGLRFSGQYSLAVALFDDIDALCRLMADIMAQGIYYRFYA